MRDHYIAYNANAIIIGLIHILSFTLFNFNNNNNDLNSSLLSNKLNMHKM